MLAMPPHVPDLAMRPVDATRRLGQFGNPIAAIDPEHTFDATNDAAHRATHDRTDRTGDAAAFIETVRGTAGHALSLGQRRHGEHGGEYADRHKSQSHGTILLCCSSLLLFGV